MKNRVFIICLMCCTIFDMGIHPSTAKNSEPSDKASLDAWLSGTRENPILTIRLTNIGIEAITVDRELVFLPTVQLRDESGKIIPFKHLRSIERSEVAELERRLTVLNPGDKIKRKVSLRGEFKTFTTMIGQPADDQAEPYHLYSAYESFCQMPEDAGPSEIEVSYVPGYSFEDCFRVLYMEGIRDIDRFYLGSLTVRIPYVFQPERQ